MSEHTSTDTGPALALDGDDVRRLAGGRPGPHVGAALRWLQDEVRANPELNTPEALRALLRYGRAPTSHTRGRSEGPMRLDHIHAARQRSVTRLPAAATEAHGRAVVRSTGRAGDAQRA